MQMKIILNTDIPFGEVLNALGHMTVGFGHRIQGIPTIDIFFGTTDQIREFRRLATMQNKANPEGTMLSDFPNTMTGGDTDQQLSIGKQTPEVDLKYLGACFIAKKISSDLESFTQSCLQLVDYTPHIGENETTLLPSRTDYSEESKDKKIGLLINNKLRLVQVINAMVISGLHIGKEAPFHDLRLLNVLDKDGNVHPNISYHPLTVLKPSDVKKHKKVLQDLETSGLVHQTVYDSYNAPLSTVAFGEKQATEKVFSKANTRLFDDKLKEEELQKCNPFQKNKIAFIGSGKISNSLVENFVRNGCPKDNITISNRSPKKLQSFVEKHGVTSSESNSVAVKDANIIVIAVGAKSVEAVAKEISPYIDKERNPIVILLAPISVDKLQQWLGKGINIVRVMTNTPSSIGQGATVLFAKEITPFQKNLVEFLFSATGKFFWVNMEEQLVSLTPLAGCGGAVILFMIEAMRDAMIKQGISPEIAESMALQVVSGTMALVTKTGTPISQLREEMTTPNGITEAVLKSLSNGEVPSLVEKSFTSGKERCEELEGIKNEDLVKPKLTEFFELKTRSDPQTKTETNPDNTTEKSFV